MPKANFRLVPGADPFREFECSVCKVRFHGISTVVGESLAVYEDRVRTQKAALFDEWHAHLRSAHPRQWEFQQAKTAKRLASYRANADKRPD